MQRRKEKRLEHASIARCWAFWQLLQKAHVFDAVLTELAHIDARSPRPLRAKMPSLNRAAPRRSSDLRNPPRRIEAAAIFPPRHARAPVSRFLAFE
jgi:hypothetical protein